MSFLGYNNAYKKNGTKDGLPARVWWAGEETMVLVGESSFLL